MMQTKLKDFFKNKEMTPAVSGSLSSPEIYVTDRKEEAEGDIVVGSMADYNVKGVVLHNESGLEVSYYAFAEYSFKKETINAENEYSGFEPLNSRECYRHCECILFPGETEGGSWILLVETKYARDWRAASKREHDYPHSLIEQIISTSEYLRRHGIIPLDKKIDALVSFPNVIINFQSTLFIGNVYRENENRLDIRKNPTNNEMTLTQITKKYRIRIKAQNSAVIQDGKKLIFQEKSEQ